MLVILLLSCVDIVYVCAEITPNDVCAAPFHHASDSPERLEQQRVASTHNISLQTCFETHSAHNQSCTSHLGCFSDEINSH